MKLKFLSLLATITVIHAQRCQDGELRSNVVKSEHKTTIVDVHNLLRSCVALGHDSEACKRAQTTYQNQPKGSNIRELGWDDYLANQAQIWANNCKFEHNKVKDSRFYVGQNLAISMQSDASAGCDPDWKWAVKYWFDEQKHYKYGPLPDPGPEVTGHYTQVIWANTYLVGCGYACYKKSDGWLNKLYVCNYGPGGNYYGEKPYKAGDPDCSGNGYKEAKTPGLCQKG